MTKSKLHLLAVLLTACQVLMAQNITDLAVMSDHSSATADLDDWTSGPAIDDSVFLHPDRIRYDARCLQIEGQDVFLLSGTFHYFRTPEPLWRDRLEKIRAAGFNCVETYVPWNWHEREMPTSPTDFSEVDLGELDRFLTLAEDVGLYAIVRPGPYICAEWSGGGFPQWLMRVRPSETLHEVWLQSMDSTFLLWNDHWYDAVCRTVAPHLLTRKAVGARGVVLVQVENEFNRIKWFPREEKRAYLEHMAARLRRGGIDVPLISCWTDEARNATAGPLNGVIDMVNSYPRWQIRKGFGRLINQQLRSQPGKPLISGELQGGWSSDLSTRLSWDMDGQTPAQTQNITLYALQRGFCALNFYMLVGGTNFDDWAARNQTATYDFAAAIGEDGSVNERYHRLAALADFINEHGTRVARSRVESVAFESTDTLVELLVRCHPDGTRYLFVRTEEHTRPHTGTLRFCLDGRPRELPFELEPFGSKVYVLSPDKEHGTWCPSEVEHTGRPAPHKVVLALAATPVQAVLPTKKGWTSLAVGQTVDDLGLYARHFLYYKICGDVRRGGSLAVPRVGRNQMNRTEADAVLALANGQLLFPRDDESDTARFVIPAGTRSLVFLYDSRGLHHHTNAAVERHWHIGPGSVSLDGKVLPLAFAPSESRGTRGLSSPLLAVYLSTFTTPTEEELNGNPLWLRLRHHGNGFVYLNGHCLGRCYEAGPQTEFYLPECWFHTDRPNQIEVTLMPTLQGADISEMSLVQ